jgi:hypothetical protein
MESNYREIIDKAYAGFNARKIDDVLQLMHPNVTWPKAFEGEYVTGHDEIRDYWTKQWSEINPRVLPLSVNKRADGKFVVEVDQMVKDMEGNILFNGKVEHIYRIDNNLILGMEIENM